MMGSSLDSGGGGLLGEKVEVRWSRHGQEQLAALCHTRLEAAGLWERGGRRVAATTIPPSKASDHDHHLNWKIHDARR